VNHSFNLLPNPLFSSVFLLCDFIGILEEFFGLLLCYALGWISWRNLVLGCVQHHLGWLPSISMHEHLESWGSRNPFSLVLKKFMKFVVKVWSFWEDATPDFPKKTKCNPICMPGSSFMHIVTYKWIQKQYTYENGRLSEIYALSWKRRHQTSQAVDWGLHTPSSNNIFTNLHSIFLFLSNIVYSKSEHLSYSASVGEVWMQRLYSGLGLEHLAF
jgi:hypothetical protein